MEITKTALEYGVMAVEALMHKYVAQKLPPEGSFFYTQGVCLWGVQQIYQLTRDKRYFKYIKDYVDSVIAPDGSIYGMVHELKVPKISRYAPKSLAMLDCKQPSVLLHLLYDETGDEKYMKGIKAVGESMYYYPVNQYGGYWHMMTQPYQMWLDGSYMAGILSVMYAKRFGDNTLRDRAVKQILLMHDHMRDEKTGLYYHAWDDSKKMPWADPETGLSPQFWGRGMGWYPVAVMDILEYLPEDHPEAETLKHIVRGVFEAIVKYQDPKSGMWYQVLDQIEREDNWLESSVTHMFCYAFVKARRMGVIGDEYDEVIERAYRGIIGNCYLDEDGYLVIDNVCRGACVGDYEYYINRPKAKNDMHGIGTFCFLMAEIEKCSATQLSRSPRCDLKL